MATVKLDKTIVSFLRKVRKNPNYGNGTATGVVASAIRHFAAKHEKCFSCEFHRDQVAGLELGRQQMALEAARAGAAGGAGGEWVLCDGRQLGVARMIARNYRRTAKQIVEQAILEHLTRPPNCASCPFYAEMCQGIKDKK